MFNDQEQPESERLKQRFPHGGWEPV
jgi:hypothetical protein